MFKKSSLFLLLLSTLFILLISTKVTVGRDLGAFEEDYYNYPDEYDDVAYIDELEDDAYAYVDPYTYQEFELDEDYNNNKNARPTKKPVAKKKAPTKKPIPKHAHTVPPKYKRELTPIAPSRETVKGNSTLKKEINIVPKSVDLDIAAKDPKVSIDGKTYSPGNTNVDINLNEPRVSIETKTTSKPTPPKTGDAPTVSSATLAATTPAVVPTEIPKQTYRPPGLPEEPNEEPKRPTQHGNGNKNKPQHHKGDSDSDDENGAPKATVVPLRNDNDDDDSSKNDNKHKGGKPRHDSDDDEEESSNSDSNSNDDDDEDDGDNGGKTSTKPEEPTINPADIIDQSEEERLKHKNKTDLEESEESSTASYTSTTLGIFLTSTFILLISLF